MTKKKKEKTTSINELQREQLDKSLSEAKEFKDKYYLTLAELENTRKRLQKEKQEMTKFAAQNVISDFLIPLDNFEKALGFTDQMNAETKNWALGFQMILDHFKTALAENNVFPFESLNTKFDPHLHEAVEVEETHDKDEGIITEEFLKGYKCGERVLRPARVKVTKRPAQQEATLNIEENHEEKE